MSHSTPKRLRAEEDLSKPLREALRELPNQDPNAAQLESLRLRLGLRAKVRDPELSVRLLPVSSPSRHSASRKLRRTVAALVLFPVAAAAAVGGVVELAQRASVPVNTASGPEAAAIAANPRPRTRFAATASAASAASPVAPLAADDTTEFAHAVPSVAPRSSNSAANAELPGQAAPTAPLSASGLPPVAAFDRAPAPSTSLAAEIALLQRANSALKVAPARALAFAAQHRQQFPIGNLAQEREVIAIKALEAIGETERARAGLVSFERAYPHSAYVLELRQIVR